VLPLFSLLRRWDGRNAYVHVYTFCIARRNDLLLNAFIFCNSAAACVHGLALCQHLSMVGVGLRQGGTCWLALLLFSTSATYCLHNRLLSVAPVLFCLQNSCLRRAFVLRRYSWGGAGDPACTLPWRSGIPQRRLNSGGRHGASHHYRRSIWKEERRRQARRWRQHFSCSNNRTYRNETYKRRLGVQQNALQERKSSGGGDFSTRSLPASSHTLTAPLAGRRRWR